MTIDLQANKTEFEGLCKKYIKREGVDRLLKWLESNDFYTAPASTRYHLCVEGGLCQHSLYVFHRMVDLCEHLFEVNPEDEGVVCNGKTTEDDGAFDIENIAIVALFHDICKVNCYVRDFKNVKVNGKWEQQEYWRWDEQFIWSEHGAKSVYMIQQFMRLYIDEAQAIAFHMGAAGDPLSEIKDKRFAQVFDKSVFAFMLHMADMWATYIDEREEN